MHAKFQICGTCSAEFHKEKDEKIEKLKEVANDKLAVEMQALKDKYDVEMKNTLNECSLEIMLKN